jgi:hypothetical protein
MGDIGREGATGENSGEDEGNSSKGGLYISRGVFCSKPTCCDWLGDKGDDGRKAETGRNPPSTFSLRGSRFKGSW